jgi:hypothetical protein
MVKQTRNGKKKCVKLLVNVYVSKIKVINRPIKVVKSRLLAIKSNGTV